MSLLVLVSGLPAAGKSTLARRLSGDLGLPLLCRDRLRGTIADLIDVAPPEELWRQGRTLDQIINHVAERLLDVGVGAVIDSNFNWPEQRAAIRQLIEARQPDCFEVCLWADEEVLRRRFVHRNDPPLTPELDVHFTRAVGRVREPVLSPPAPVAHFDTSDFGALDEAYAGLVAQIRENSLVRK